VLCGFKAKNLIKMTDKEIYERFMLWMGMKPSKTKKVEENTVIRYEDIYNCYVRFTKTGYDEFYSGAVFDENGKIVKAYIDSHVAYASDNCKEIDKILED
jgi:hypothetical protein